MHKTKIACRSCLGVQSKSPSEESHTQDFSSAAEPCFSTHSAPFPRNLGITADLCLTPASRPILWQSRLIFRGILFQFLEHSSMFPTSRHCMCFSSSLFSALPFPSFVPHLNAPSTETLTLMPRLNTPLYQVQPPRLNSLRAFIMGSDCFLCLSPRLKYLLLEVRGQPSCSSCKWINTIQVL